MNAKLSQPMQGILEILRRRGPITYSPRLSANLDRTVKALVRRGLVNVNHVYASDNWRVTLVDEKDTPASRQALATEAPRQVTNWLDPETGQPVGGVEPTPDGFLIDNAETPGQLVGTLEYRGEAEPTREELIAAMLKRIDDLEKRVGVLERSRKMHNEWHEWKDGSDTYGLD